MKHVVTKLSNHLTDLKQAISLAQSIIKNNKATAAEKDSAVEKVEELKDQVKQTETAIKILSLTGANDVYPQNKHWDQVENIIEKRPRNSMGTALAYLSEIFLLIKK